VLKTCFRDFLGRGSIDDCWQLVPQSHKAAISTKCRLSIVSSNLAASDSVRKGSYPKGTSSCGAPQDISISPVPISNTPVSKPALLCGSSPNTFSPIYTSSGAQHDPSSLASVIQSTADNSSSSLVAEKYFKGRCSDPDRIHRLVRIVRAFNDAKALPERCYEELWSPKKGLFNGSESGLDRFRRLQRGRTKIMQHIIEYDCANRLGLMFVAHDVDHLSLMSADLKLGPGRSRKTAAFEKLADISGTELQSLKEDYKRSRNYFHLLEKAGPGTLLELGSQVAST